MGYICSTLWKITSFGKECAELRYMFAGGVKARMYVYRIGCRCRWPTLNKPSEVRLATEYRKALAIGITSPSSRASPPSSTESNLKEFLQSEMIILDRIQEYVELS